MQRGKIFDVLEIRDGDFRLATKDGLLNFNPRGKCCNRVVTSSGAARLIEKPMFTVSSETATIVNKLLQDARGVILDRHCKGFVSTAAKRR